MPHWMIASATNDSTQALRELSPWLAVLVAMVFVGGVVIMIVRRHLRSSGDLGDVGYTLHDLRKMHASGELSDEEFEKARSAMIAGVRSSTGRKDASDEASSGVRISDVNDGASEEKPDV